MMPTWEIGRLRRDHERTTFDCGRTTLDDWLKARAGQFDRKDLSRTYVATQPGSPVVVGFYAILSHQVLFETVPKDESKGLPRLDLPVVLLGKLAVDRMVQGQGLGSLLLIDALRRALTISEQIGVRAVEVHALDESAINFYRNFGFRTLLDDSHHLLIPMHEVRKLKLDPLP